MYSILYPFSTFLIICSWNLCGATMWRTAAGKRSSHTRTPSRTSSWAFCVCASALAPRSGPNCSHSSLLTPSARPPIGIWKKAKSEIRKLATQMGRFALRSTSAAALSCASCTCTARWCRSARAIPPNSSTRQVTMVAITSISYPACYSTSKYTVCIFGIFIV